MFIREVKKQRSKSSRVFYQYNLVQASRVDGRVRQTIILYLGSDEALRDKYGRKLVLEVLKSKIFGQPGLFPSGIPEDLEKLALSYYEKYLIRYNLDEATALARSPDRVSHPPLPQRAEYENVDISGLEVEEVKRFGAEHLCGQVLDKLGLKGCLETLGMDSGQVSRALIAIAARAVFASSEHKTAQLLSMNSELSACLGYKDPVSHKQLYASSDILYQHKDRIDAWLYQRITDMFDITDRLVIFDISNTYFEAGKRQSSIAKYGRSKEKRNDCPLVVFTGVVNAQGFIRHSRIYEGSRPDGDTLGEMLADLQAHSNSNSKKTVVMDAGIASEDNLLLIREKGYDYVCVSRKRLKDYPVPATPVIQPTNRESQKVELAVFNPKDQPDTWLYVQSDMKRNKEHSMIEKLSVRFEEDLQDIKAALSKKRGTKKTEKVWERIGRAKQKHQRVSGRYHITVDQENGTAHHMHWTRKDNPIAGDKEKGIYFIRTSYKSPSEKELWDIYNTIREVESTFRCLKSDLLIRPVHHQKDSRVEAHIYLTLLAYQLVNTIRYMLKSQGIHYDWKNILRIMSTHTIQTVVLPTDKKEIHLRKPSKPIKEVQDIYKATGCKHTQKPIRKHVVYH